MFSKFSGLESCHLEIMIILPQNILISHNTHSHKLHDQADHFELEKRKKNQLLDQRLLIGMGAVKVHKGSGRTPGPLFASSSPISASHSIFRYGFLGQSLILMLVINRCNNNIHDRSEASLRLP